MKIIKLSTKTEDDKQKMEDWFEKRTKKHIERVQKYCKKIADYNSEFNELIERGETHDQSKFKDPEIEMITLQSKKSKMQCIF